MNLIFKQSINSPFDIALFLQSKGYRQNHDYIGVPSGKCGFTTLSLFSRRLPQF